MHGRSPQEIENDKDLILRASFTACTIKEISSVTKLTLKQISKNFAYDPQLKKQVWEHLEKNCLSIRGFSKYPRTDERITDDCQRILNSSRKSKYLTQVSKELGLSKVQISRSLKRSSTIYKQVIEQLKDNRKTHGHKKPQRTPLQMKEDNLRIIQASLETKNINELLNKLNLSKEQLYSNYRKNPELQYIVKSNMTANIKREFEKINENGVV